MPNSLWFSLICLDSSLTHWIICSGFSNHNGILHKTENNKSAGWGVIYPTIQCTVGNKICKCILRELWLCVVNAAPSVKMALGCLLACRRLSPMSIVLDVLLWAIWLFVVETAAALTYDRQALLDLHLSSSDCCIRILIEDHFFNSLMSSTFPVVTCQSTGCCLHRKKCLRKRGKI